MRRLLKKHGFLIGAIAVAPGGLVLLSAAAIVGGCVAVPVWALRRYMDRNRVMVIKPPTMPVLKIVNGGKA